ncbi:MAG: 2,3-bisphosphoglycerate-dependent phosphoglycerate mutase [Candidatus Kaiserbacteria bacterium]|nr:2,3-bisphosphoglycerate-dependent phosphoglycerate mutase [Candidatus Kaiserbacteria bacterium]
MAGKLLIARHHESEWNKKGLWTGTRNVPLTPYGFQKSADMGHAIQGISIDTAFSSMQVRTIETLACMLMALELHDVPVEHARELNERDYGDYTGKNKWDMKKLIGDEEFERVRREWDCPVPNGETLKMVYERVIPFYQKAILPLLVAGKNVLVVAHGNSLRALMAYIETIAPEDVKNIEMLFGSIVIYGVDKEGRMTGKEVRQIASEVPA